MPFTVITLSKVPQSLRGDLSKWMQEIAVGVYVGTINSRVREQLWKRVCRSTDQGEATLSYATRNELGYSFETYNTKQVGIDSDGIPLVLYPVNTRVDAKKRAEDVFSNARLMHIRRSTEARRTRTIDDQRHVNPYVIMHIISEITVKNENHITEIGAIKFTDDGLEEWQLLVKDDHSNLTEELYSLKRFIDGCILVGYNINDEIRQLRIECSKVGIKWTIHRCIDLLDLVRHEQLFLDNYKLSTVLSNYGVEGVVQNHALEDARLINTLGTKLKVFKGLLEKKA